MKRTMFAFLIAVALAFTLTGSGSAFIGSLTLDSKASLADSKLAAVVSGTIQCSDGNDVSITVIVQQNSGKVDAAGQGFVDIVCTGFIQTWSLTVDVVIGTNFKHGPAHALFSASDLTDNSFFPTQTARVKL